MTREDRRCLDPSIALLAFARRSDITLEAFGWKLRGSPDGPCYRQL